MRATLEKKHKFACPITFIDTHKLTPTFFPVNAFERGVMEAPDLVGVFRPSEFDDGKLQVPHHLIEAIVEANFLKVSSTNGLAQAAAYSYCHLQARPDHPSVYCLIVKPQGYRILLSDFTGITVSEQSYWSDLKLLEAYIYSIYYPPRNHCMVDESVSLQEINTQAPATWIFKFGKRKYVDGQPVSIGAAWGRSTRVYAVRTNTKAKDELLIKQYYRHSGRRFKEEVILNHTHADGIIPGVVRLLQSTVVPWLRTALSVGTTEGNTDSHKVRLLLLDQGEPLAKARSVNDLLMCFYDVLEGTLLSPVDLSHHSNEIPLSASHASGEQACSTSRYEQVQHPHAPPTHSMRQGGPSGYAAIYPRDFIRAHSVSYLPPWGFCGS